MRTLEAGTVYLSDEVKMRRKKIWVKMRRRNEGRKGAVAVP